MAWARRASVYAEKPVSVSGTSDTLAAAAAVSAGDCIIATASYTGTTSMHASTGFTDSVGNSYTTYGPVVDGSNRKCYIGVALNSGAGTPTVTYTFSGATVATLTVDAFSGIATSSAKEGSDGTGTTASGTTVAISGTTSTTNNDLLYVACLAGAATTWSNAGYTINQPTASRTMVGFADASTAGAESTTCTSSATTALVGLMIALAPAGAVSIASSPLTTKSNLSNVSLTITKTGGNFSGSETFTVTGAGTKVSQTNPGSQATATVVINTTNHTFGDIIVSDGTSSCTVTCWLNTSDSNGEWSGNWVTVADTSKTTIWPGAMARLCVTGTTTLTAQVAVAASGVNAADYPKLRYSVNYGAWSTLTAMTAGQTTFAMTGLTSNKNNVVHLVLDAMRVLGSGSPAGGQSWTGTNILTITGFAAAAAVTAAATVAPASAPYAAAYAKKATILSLSTETGAESLAAGSDSVIATKYFNLCLGLNWRFTMIASKGRGLTTDGDGGIPRMYDTVTPGAGSPPANQLWNYLNSTTTADLSSEDYIFLVGGMIGNDARNSVSQADMTANLTALLPLIRTAAPAAKIFVDILENRNVNAAGLAAAAAGYAAFSDANKAYFDSGAFAAWGLNGDTSVIPQPSSGATWLSAALPHLKGDSGHIFGASLLGYHVGNALATATTTTGRKPPIGVGGGYG